MVVSPPRSPKARKRSTPCLARVVRPPFFPFILEAIRRGDNCFTVERIETRRLIFLATGRLLFQTGRVNRVLVVFLRQGGLGCRIISELIPAVLVVGNVASD